MAVKYRLVQRKDMSKDAAPDAKLVYAVSSSTGMCDTAQMCDIIADRSAATPGDVKLVLDGVLHVLKQKLPDGQTVQLGDLGYIQVVLGSKGAATEKDFSANLIKSRRILFRPGKVLVQLAQNFKTERYATSGSTTTPPKDDEDDRPVIE
ncbi:MULTISPECIES: HU family DNA-binding protein [Parabacteroides]|jgi:predicted histone-like DNA-binding protein|uniref:HU family DNA-binding protein n=1 Tax=Parabacteroides TaxID=375288 RepID=UPI000F00E0F7|nr:MULTISPECIES: HU family DNA-binding protein [Parabacteroides]RHU24583.1 DNA-binding protein [Parabacteroides sp. TM07-1AC]WFE83334.1 HU family DNA-binding protein [Parabacteroides chongii]